MGLAERARWGIGTLPIIGTPTNIAYWVYSNSLPTAAAVGTTYAASKYLVNPTMFKIASWMSKATGHPATYGQVAKNVGEWKMYHTLKMLGFQTGPGHTVMRQLPRSSLGGRYAMQKLGPLRALPYQTGRGAMIWRPHMSVFLRSLGFAWLAYDAHKIMSHRHANTGMSMYDVMNPKNEKVWKTSFWG